MAGRLGREARLVALAARLGPALRGTLADRGATATEYAVLVGFIAVVIATAIGFFGTSLGSYYSYLVSAVGTYL